MIFYPFLHIGCFWIYYYITGPFPCVADSPFEHEKGNMVWQLQLETTDSEVSKVMVKRQEKGE